MASSQLKEARYELVEVPEPMGPVEVTVDRRKVLDYAYCVNDFGSWYFTESPFDGPVGHPLVLANDLLFLFYENYDGNTAQGLHTHEHLTFHAPIPVGEKVTVSGGYVEKYERRGQGYVTLEAEARDANGDLLVRHRGKEIMRTIAGEVVGQSRAATAERKRSVRGTVDRSLPVVEHARLDAPVRAAIPTRTTSFTQDQMLVFSWAGRGYSNVHTHSEKAVAAGLDKTIVQAQQQTGLLVANAVEFFGTSFFTTGELDLRFVSPAFVGDELTAGGAVSSVDGDRVEIEVWIDKEDGARTALGWASAVVTDDDARPVHLL